MTSIAFRRSLKLTADALQLMRTGSTLEKALSAACAQARPEEKAAVQSMLYSCARRAYLCEALIDNDPLQTFHANPNEVFHAVLFN